MGCLLQFGKAIFIFIFVSLILFFVAGAFIVDLVIVLDGKEPYFFDPDKIEEYDEPMFTKVEKGLIKHYHSHKDAIQTAGRALAELPQHQRVVEVTYLNNGEIAVMALYDNGSGFETPIDYHNNDTSSLLLKTELSPQQLDDIKAKLKPTGCTAFQIGTEGYRIAKKDGKDGTFYYSFANTSSLPDSCLFKVLDEKVFLEYKGPGRGPDCIRSRNPVGYDDRSFFQKWVDLLRYGGEAVFKDADY